MAIFRLYNVEEDRLESFPLDSHPPYLATSHVWKENVFPIHSHFKECFGGQGTAVVIRERYPDIRYCWFDTRCIDQNDERDKQEQIPLMDRIYGEAECIIIFLATHLNANQSQVDWLMRKVDGALAMCQAQAWEEEGAYWQSSEGRRWLSVAMNALIRLARSAWATRVWTLQEYVLAKKVIWIGQDLEPIEVDDYAFSALPDICDTLVIDELLGPEHMILNQYFLGMLNARLKAIDRTRIMELSVFRQATMPVDEIYGVMAASGVTIRPQLNETKAGVWARWCAEAVRCGHVRWILLPASFGILAEEEQENCIFPHLLQRHQLSSSSGLDGVRPLGPISINNGTVTAWARSVGSGRLTRRLGPVHGTQTGKIHRDITLILFAQAKWSLALKLVRTFGGGRYNLKQTKVIAQVMVQSYARAARSVAYGKEDNFRPFISSNLQQYVWSDFMALQQTMMMSVNNGIAYLCDIYIGSAKEASFEAVVVLSRPPSQRQFEVLDFDATGPDQRTVLMAVGLATLVRDESTIFHKFGTTIGLSEDIVDVWRSVIPAKEVRIGGYGCSECQADRNPTTHGLVEPKLASIRSIPRHRVRMLERHENRMRLKLFSLQRSRSHSSFEAHRKRLQARKWRNSLQLSRVKCPELSRGEFFNEEISVPETLY